MLIATLPPLLKHNKEIANNVMVGGLRINTAMPIIKSEKETLREMLDLAGVHPLWVDLKCRQLRITCFGDPTYELVEISHKIKVNLPCEVLFKDCKGTIVDIIDGNKLVLAMRPNYIVGKGQPINILDGSLEIEGFLTESDKRWIEAGKELNFHNYMLSFVEKASDIEEVRSLDPKSQLVLKIESQKGIEFVLKDWNNNLINKSGLTLMAARDDLYINMGQHKALMIRSLEEIIKADPNAIAASRILTSLEKGSEPDMHDFCDLQMLHQMGYAQFMLSDGLCCNLDAFRLAIDCFWSWSNNAYGVGY